MEALLSTNLGRPTFGLLVGNHPGRWHSQVIDVTAQRFALP